MTFLPTIHSNLTTVIMMIGMKKKNMMAELFSPDPKWPDIVAVVILILCIFFLVYCISLLTGV